MDSSNGYITVVELFLKNVDLTMYLQSYQMILMEVTTVYSFLKVCHFTILWPFFAQMIAMYHYELVCNFHLLKCSFRDTSKIYYISGVVQCTGTTPPVCTCNVYVTFKRVWSQGDSVGLHRRVSSRCFWKGDGARAWISNASLSPGRPVSAE